MELEGIVRNGVVVPNNPELLPEGAKVKLLIESTKPGCKMTLSERLLRHAGTVPDMPADFAEQHDHYIHGTPKR